MPDSTSDSIDPGTETPHKPEPVRRSIVASIEKIQAELEVARAKLTKAEADASTAKGHISGLERSLELINEK